MKTFVYTVIFLVICGVIGVGVNWLRDRARRSIHKDKYQKEKALTEQYTVITTTASADAIQNELTSRLYIDHSTKADIKGDNYHILERTPQRMVLKHNSTLSVWSKTGDEFTASIAFQPNGESLRVIVKILNFYEIKGVATQTALDAMQSFLDDVTAAVRAVDQRASVAFVQGAKK